jgi:tripartite-type tricarboxylate transporter receptor subunit TctC
MTSSRLGLSVLAVLPAAGADAPYPSRPITIVVPYPPGGIADLTARPLAARRLAEVVKRIGKVEEK